MLRREVTDQRLFYRKGRRVRRQVRIIFRLSVDLIDVILRNGADEFAVVSVREPCAASGVPEVESLGLADVASAVIERHVSLLEIRDRLSRRRQIKDRWQRDGRLP